MVHEPPPTVQSPVPQRRDSASGDDWFLTRGLSSTIHGSAKFPGIAKLLEEEKRRRTARMSEIVETSPTHARSVDDMATRGKSPSDSGIGSCTESDTSDCEKKLKLWKLEAENRGRSIIHPTERSSGPFFPDWKRIKKFYGIPRPGGPGLQTQEEEDVPPRTESELSTPVLVVTKRQSSESQALDSGKQRSETIP